MATANRPAVPVPPTLSKIKDPDTRMAMQALLDGWQVRNGWSGTGENKFLTKADLEDYLSDPANAKFLSQVTGAGGTGGTGGSDGSSGLAADQIRDLSEWIKTTWLWKTLHEVIPDIYSNTGLKKAVETLSTAVGAVDIAVKTVSSKVVGLFTLLGVSTTVDGKTVMAGKYETFDAYIDDGLAAFARGEDGIIAKSGGLLAASVNVTQALTGSTAEILAATYGWPIAGAVTAATTNITTLAAQNAVTKNALESAMMVSDNPGSGVVAAYTLRANVLEKDHPDYKAGFGFSIERINGELRSIFLVGADTFAVYDPRVTDTTGYVLPFIVSNGKVYMNDAVVVTLMADNIKGDVNKIIPISGGGGATFGSGRYDLVYTQDLPDNPTHGHRHFAMLNITAQVGGDNGTMSGVYIDAHILDQNGLPVSSSSGFSLTNTMGGVSVTVAAPERSTNTGKLVVYARCWNQTGVIQSIGGICGGLR